MAQNRLLLGAAFVCATLLAFHAPARSQDAVSDPPASESNINHQPAMEPETAAPVQAEQSPAAEHPKATSKKKSAHKNTHHKKKKKKAKKKTHKKSKHAKHAKKKKTHTAKHTTKHEKKSVVAAPVKEEEAPKQAESMKQEEPALEATPVQEAEPAKDIEPVKEAAPVKKAQKHTPAHKKTATAKQAPKVAKIEKKPAASVAHTASVGNEREVTFTFCLGYDNCVPHRYEAKVHSGGVAAKVLKEQGDQGWVDAKIDPVMEADLAEMARNEPGGNMVRPLSQEEKERIADHQGKAHVELVHAVNGGATNKEQVKQMLHNLKITSAEDLNAYDPRLCKNETAMQAASELSSGR